MRDRDYYKFKYIFNLNNDTGYHYLDIGFTYLGFIIRNRFHKGNSLKYYINVEETIELLLKGFNNLLKKDNILKYVKLDYNIIYKELKDIIKKGIEQYNNSIEEI